MKSNLKGKKAERAVAAATVADGLSKLLADTYTLYLQTHNFHWNVTGPSFHSLHTLFETQYTELALAVDEIAERIRALGVYAPGSYKEFASISSVKETEGSLKAKEMVEILLKHQEIVADTARDLIPMAQEIGDDPTVDLLVRRIQVHEKNAWMLRVTLE